NFTIGGLLHDTEYALLVDGGNRKILISSTSGHLMFVIPSDGDQSITLTLNTDAPVTDLLIGSPHSLVGEITIITSSTHLTLNVHDIKGIGIDFTTYRTWNLNQWSNWQTYSNPFTVGGDDGNRFVEYYSVDNSGSIEITKNSTIVLDNTPPNTNVSISQPNYGNAPAYVGKTTEISLIAMDEVAGIDATWFRVDSEPFDSYLGPFNLSRYRGMHVVEYGSVDMVGNNESVNDILVYVDDVPPISIIHVGVPRALHDGAIYANSETEFSISLTDEGSGSESIWFRVDNGDWTPYDGAYTISEEGPHKISYNSTDNLGNHEEPKSIEVFVDNTAPTANAGSYDEVERGSAFSFNGTLSEDNSLIVSFTWSVNDILLHGMNPPFTFNRTGKYIVKLTVSDALGNEDIDTVRIEVTDTTPPVPPTGIEVEPQGWGVLQISWNPGLDEDLSGYHVYKSDNPGGPYFRISEVIVTQTCFGDTELLDGGTYFYMVTAVDSSGNEGRRSLEAFGTTLSSPELVFPSEYWWVMAVTLILMPVFTVLFLVIRREKEKHAVE
ncbi:MAG: PKD domain-containing protein, partial [Thermoplasmata archaeon]|nr:PKD domain-containing protein [Thermoplasmata archaeon]